MKMKVLLVAATEKEMPAGIFDIRHIAIEKLVTGIGMVPTAYQLGKRFAKNKYDLALNIGIAGAFNRDLKIGEVVNVVEDQTAYFGAEDNKKFIDIFDLGFEDANKFPFTNGKLMNRQSSNLPILKSLNQVSAITVNTTHGNQKSIQQTITQYAPDIETMEGAAFFYVCFSENVPCLHIRTISNYVEPRDKSKWNIEFALKNLHTKINTVLNDLPMIRNKHQENP